MSEEERMIQLASMVSPDVRKHPRFAEWMHLLMQRSRSMRDMWQAEECARYCTTDDVEHMIVTENAEMRWVCDHFISIQSKVPGMQDPDVTFGEQVRTDTCRRCKSNTTVRMIIQQRRKLDEDADVSYVCDACGMRWK